RQAARASLELAQLCRSRGEQGAAEEPRVRVIADRDLQAERSVLSPRRHDSAATVRSSADRRATTACVRTHACEVSRGRRIRTWLLAKDTSVGFTPGSPPPARSRMAVARER